MFLVSDRVAVTAKHVLDGGGTAIGRWDGLWATEVVANDAEQDVAVVALTKRLQSRDFEPDQVPSGFPTVSGDPLQWGDEVAIIGSFHRQHVGQIQPVGHTIITKGIVAFMTIKPWQWAVHGAFAEPGFSGGPAFRSDGELVGVVTSVRSTKSLTELAVPMDFPLISPLIIHRKAIQEAIAKHG